MKLTGALLLRARGLICIYQGEELGQTETYLELHELTDPQGIRFWPENKGRDGCRHRWSGTRQSRTRASRRPGLAAGEGAAGRARGGGPAPAQGFGARVYRRMLALRRETEELRTGVPVLEATERCRVHPWRQGVVRFDLSPERHEVLLSGAGEDRDCRGRRACRRPARAHPTASRSWRRSAPRKFADVPGKFAGRREQRRARRELIFRPPRSSAERRRPGRCPRSRATRFGSTEADLADRCGDLRGTSDFCGHCLVPAGAG